MKSAADQMELDRELIENLAHQKEILVRCYEWRAPTITYGCFIDPKEYLTAPIPGFELAKRPTGGGMLFHLYDFPFTVAVPRSHPAFADDVLHNYHFVNSAVVRAVEQVLGKNPFKLQAESEKGAFAHFCMATPTRYDIMMNGLKIGGAAQRKTAHGFVHQGALFLEAPPWELLEQYLVNGKEAVKSMRETAAFIELGGRRGELARAIETEFSAKCKVQNAKFFAN